MEERNITPEESILIIKQMIQKTRERVVNDGFYFLLWGFLVIAGCLVTYFAHITKHFEIINPAWMVLLGIGVLWSTLVSVRQGKRQHHIGQIDFIGKMLWLAFLVSMFIVMFIIKDYELMNTAMLILIGFATFVSGAILRFKPLYVGGILFWIGAIIIGFIPFPYASLFYAGIMLAGYVIPGILLTRKVKMQKQRAGAITLS